MLWNNTEKEKMERPIFILGCGWRTGSTLLQRLLCSHPEIHIWGENHGVVYCLQRAAELIKELECLSEKHWANFQQHGTDGWIAMMNPPTDQFCKGLRVLLETYYRDPARELGKVRWGFKEVRYDMTVARFLQNLYPESKYLVIIRNPADCLASARATRTMFLKNGLLAEVGGTEMFLRQWAKLGASFLDPLDDNRMLRLRYEDVIANPDRTIRQVGEFLNIDSHGLVQAVFNVRRRGWLEREPRLAREDRDALSAAWLWEVAKEYGYAPV